MTKTEQIARLIIFLEALKRAEESGRKFHVEWRGPSLATGWQLKTVEQFDAKLQYHVVFKPEEFWILDSPHTQDAIRVYHTEKMAQDVAARYAIKKKPKHCQVIDD